MLGLKIYLRKNSALQRFQLRRIDLEHLTEQFHSKAVQNSVIFMVTLFHSSVCANFITLQPFLLAT